MANLEDQTFMLEGFEGPFAVTVMVYVSWRKVWRKR